MIEIKATQIDIKDDVVMPGDKGLTVGEIFTNNYDTVGSVGDVVWAYANTSYMYYDASESRFAYLTDIVSNNNISCVDLIETSDKRLKENIEDVEDDCIDLVKKINVKTYNLKGDDKKKSHIGFIADELKEILPEKFEAVVNTEGEYLGINYGKVSAILMKALQTTLNKVEHLESRLFEVEDELKELKKPKPKAKAKSKK